MKTDEDIRRVRVKRGQALLELMLLERQVDLGGPGSGNIGHAGIPGHQGGSAPKGESAVDALPVTKANINKILQWSSSKYNMLKKPEMVDIAYRILTDNYWRSTGYSGAAGIPEGAISRPAVHTNPITGEKFDSYEYKITTYSATSGSYTEAFGGGGYDWLIDGNNHTISRGTLGNTDQEFEADKVWHFQPVVHETGMLFAPLELGGAGSGNRGHAGIPGHQGGSAPDESNITDVPTANKRFPNVGKLLAALQKGDHEADAVADAFINEVMTGTRAMVAQGKLDKPTVKLLNNELGKITQGMDVLQADTATLRIERVQAVASIYTIIARAMNLSMPLEELGGPGSGNIGHAGIPGHRGGSAPGNDEEDSYDPRMQDKAGRIFRRYQKTNDIEGLKKAILNDPALFAYAHQQSIEDMRALYGARLNGKKIYRSGDVNGWSWTVDKSTAKMFRAQETEQGNDPEWYEDALTPDVQKRVAFWGGTFGDTNFLGINGGSEGEVVVIPEKEFRSLRKSTSHLSMLEELGGPGSGNIGHAGIPGHRGGSAPGVGNWVRPSDEELKHEYDIEIVKKGLGAFSSLDEFLAAAHAAPEVEVTPEMDSQIGYRSGTRTQQQLLSLIKGYRSYPKYRNEQTLQHLYDVLREGGPMDMPIVLKYGEGHMRVLGGNTRMDVAFQLGINPKVLMVTVPEKVSRTGFSITPLLDWVFNLGGRGSGNYGHAGRPGHVGGSQTVYHGASKESADYLRTHGLMTGKRSTGMSSQPNDVFTFVSPHEAGAKYFGSDNLRNTKGFEVVPMNMTGKLYQIDRPMPDYKAFGVVAEKYGLLGGESGTEYDYQSIADALRKHDYVGIQFKDSNAGNRMSYAVLPEALKITGLSMGEELDELGGRGSGNKGHAGIPGHQGGSLPTAVMEPPVEEKPEVPYIIHGVTPDNNERDFFFREWVRDENGQWVPKYRSNKDEYITEPQYARDTPPTIKQVVDINTAGWTKAGDKYGEPVYSIDHDAGKLMDMNNARVVVAFQGLHKGEILTSNDKSLWHTEMLSVVHPEEVIDNYTRYTVRFDPNGGSFLEADYRSAGAQYGDETLAAERISKTNRSLVYRGLSKDTPLKIWGNVPKHLGTPTDTTLEFAEYDLQELGGVGSGNIGHAGIPGHRGGSMPTGTQDVDKVTEDIGMTPGEETQITREVCERLQYPESEVTFLAGAGPEFTVAGDEYVMAGQYIPETGEVLVYNNKYRTRAQLEGLLAHEIEHDRWHTFLSERDAQYAQIVKESEGIADWRKWPITAEGDVRPENLDRFWAYDLTSRTIDRLEYMDKLRKADGISDYSRSYWKAAEVDTHTDVAYTAINETLAEIARRQSDDPANWRKGLAPIWRNLYTDINNRLENHVLNERWRTRGKVTT